MSLGSRIFALGFAGQGAYGSKALAAGRRSYLCELLDILSEYLVVFSGFGRVLNRDLYNGDHLRQGR